MCIFDQYALRTYCRSSPSSRFERTLGIGNTDEKTTAILENLAIPIELKRLLQWYWTTSGGQVGPYVLCSVNEIPAIRDYDKLLKYKMIPIGDAANGDILVIRFVDEDCAVGLASHDQCGKAKVILFRRTPRSHRALMDTFGGLRNRVTFRSTSTPQAS